MYHVTCVLAVTGVSIDCYVCTSINGSNKVCEDKFERNLDTFHMIERNCQYGYFKGTHCIKLKGTKGELTNLPRELDKPEWGQDNKKKITLQ